MIKLTGRDGNPLYINPRHIAAVYSNGEEYTSVVIVGEEAFYPVKESAETVFNMVNRAQKAEERTVIVSKPLEHWDLA